FVALEHALEGVAFDFGHLVFELAHLVSEGVKLGKPEFRFIDDRIGRIEIDILLQVADLGAFGDADIPHVGLHFTGDGAEKRGFAFPVVADQADALAFFDGERELVEHQAVAENFFDIVELNQGHGWADESRTEFGSERQRVTSRRLESAREIGGLRR
ncbi:MAG: hypothetical protein ACTHLZ_11025, partial [Tepidisphaeraceae bacterium]